MSDFRRLDDEVALRESALAATAEGVTISDPSLPDNPVIYANAGFERLTGYSIDEVVGRNCRFLQGPGTEDAAVDEIRDAVRHGRECTVQLLNYRKDGSSFWNRLSITPVRNQAGELTHFVGIQSDVTEQKNAEDALREANEKLEAANRRVAEDLDAAAKIQKSLLPTAMPHTPGITLSWAFRPCTELAGDILNIHPLDDRSLSLYMIDVSGHGVAAALFAVTLSRLLSAGPRGDREPTASAQNLAGLQLEQPAGVAQSLNERFPFDPGTRQYFTMLYGVLDVETLRFRYVSAGQSGPIYSPRQGSAVDLSSSGFPIGLLPNAVYEERVRQLSPGDRLFLITDGVVEAENERKEQFGMRRFLAAQQAVRGEPLKDACDALMTEVVSWSGRKGMDDDASILACEIDDGRPNSAVSAQLAGRCAPSDTEIR